MHAQVMHRSLLVLIFLELFTCKCFLNACCFYFYNDKTNMKRAYSGPECEHVRASLEGTLTRQGLTLSDRPCQMEFAEQREMFAG